MAEYKILGVDPGMSSTGWCLLEVCDGIAFYDSSGVWTSASSDSEGNSHSAWSRAGVLREQIENTFFEHGIAGSDVVAAVESPSYGSRYASHNVSFCAGLLSSVFNQFGVSDVCDVAAAGWKKKVCGDAQVSKNKVKSIVAERLRKPELESVSADEADAAGVALWKSIRTAA